MNDANPYPVGLGRKEGVEDAIDIAGINSSAWPAAGSVDTHLR